MDLNLLEKIFPEHKNYSKLKYDLEGLWSITHPLPANLISQLIKNYLQEKKIIINDLIITDTTAGLGGNTISFSKYFKLVNSIEIDKKRFKLLENNINIFELNNIKLFNINFLIKIKQLKQDVIFMDPPWGGPNYKTKKKVNISINNINLDEIIKNIAKQAKLIALKLPINFDLEEFKKNINFPIKKYYVKNFLFIIIDLF